MLGPALALGWGLLVVGIAAVLSWLRRTVLVVTVEGTSMEPALRPGDRLLVRRQRRSDQLRRGQIVVAHTNRTRPRLTHASGPCPQSVPPRTAPQPGYLIKRIAAVPGDPVPREGMGVLGDVPDIVVPEHCMVVLGDNRAVSADSRIFGYLRDEELVGVVIRPFTGTVHSSR